MTNKETQDMTGTGRFITMPEKDNTKEWQKLYKDIDDPEPERYYDWMLWKMRQQEKEEGNE